LGDFKPVGVKKEGAVLTNGKEEIDDNGINLQTLQLPFLYVGKITYI
jgi:hypothetical protein